MWKEVVGSEHYLTIDRPNVDALKAGHGEKSDWWNKMMRNT
jgi:hypothetical protein